MSAADRRHCTLLFAVIFAATLALRLCHIHILWADEDYHLAAAIQILLGKLPYRDFWYDKPPLAALMYLLIGGLSGWPLRLFDAVYILLICVAMWRFTRDLWGRREAMLAAGLMAFFLNFDFPAAVLPIAPDFFLLLPHILAVHCAWKGKPLAAGLWCGVAFLFQAKALFILATCALLLWRSGPLLLAGFALPNIAALAGLTAVGALPQYIEQVWKWGAAYAGSSPEAHAAWNGLRRTVNWLAFHATLALGTAAFWWGNRKRDSYWIAGWLILSFGSVALGARFYPRYYLALLPPLVICVAGIPGSRRVRTFAIATLLLLVIPLVRFGPRYWTLARGADPQWSDIALDQDSQAAAQLVNSRRHSGDTLFVWGYRPGVFVYTRMPVASKFWDSQPLTGVPADRHLRDATSVLPSAAENREAFAASRPVFVVDSLSLSNPQLAMDRYPELDSWRSHYQVIGRTPLSLIYELIR